MKGLHLKHCEKKSKLRLFIWYLGILRGYYFETFIKLEYIDIYVCVLKEMSKVYSDRFLKYYKFYGERNGIHNLSSGR